MLSDTCIVKSPSYVILYINTQGMPLVHPSRMVDVMDNGEGMASLRSVMLGVRE